MITVYIRSSFLGSWEFCQLKTYINYCLGIDEESGKKAVLGTMTHKVLETLALCKLRQQNGETHTITEDAIGEVPIDFPYDTDEGLDILCERAFQYYSNKSARDYAPIDLKTIKGWAKIAVTHQNGCYDPRKRKIFAAEQHFDIELTNPWAAYTYELNGEKFSGNAHIKGTIDLISEVDKDTIEVIDWKTGATRKNWATGKEKSYEDLCNDKQLMLYYYALKKLYPNKNILFTIFFIQAGGPFTLCFEDEHIGKTEDILQKTLYEVWNTNLPKMLSYRQSDFRCTRLCEYFKNNWPGSDKNICRHVHDHIKEHGIQVTTEQLMAEGFKLGKYNNPGE